MAEGYRHMHWFGIIQLQLQLVRVNQASTNFAKSALKAGQVSWSEVEHWLWPAFSPRWASWRQNRLELSPILFSGNSAAVPPLHPLRHTSKAATSSLDTSGSCPKSAEAHGVPQGVDTRPIVENCQKGRGSDSGGSSHGGGGGSSCGGGSGGGSGCGGGGGSDGGGGSGRGDSSVFCSLPASIPLLYGLSEQVIMRPGYWPSSVHCCGFWQQRHSGTVSSLWLYAALEMSPVHVVILCIDSVTQSCGHIVH